MSLTPPFNDYSSAEAWLLSITDYERTLGTGPLAYDTSTFDLRSFRAQLERLGSPHLRYAVIHVAGTKGKGSTCAFLESALRHCGFRTGLYTSPHLFRFTERIRLDGADIPDADFCHQIEKMGRMIMPETAGSDDNNDGTYPSTFRTVFEILTAAAFDYFAEQKVDIAIVETGLGGRLDSTNMFDLKGEGPLINVITAIGLDHTAILGDSVSAISAEKAGIIRPHGKTVVAPQPSSVTEDAVRNIVIRRCADIDAVEPVMVSQYCHFSKAGENGNCYTYSVQGRQPCSSSPDDTALVAALLEGLKVCPSLEGAHQAANVATALTALVQLEKQITQPEFRTGVEGRPWPRLLPDSITVGLEHTTWLGRFQVIDGVVPVVIDGAHCPMSANALAQACFSRFSARPAILITGFLRDKAGTDLLAAVFQQLPVRKAVALAPPSPRAVSTDHIESALHHYLQTDQVAVADSMKQALIIARAAAEEVNGYIIIFGSLYLVGPVLDELHRNKCGDDAPGPDAVNLC